MKTPSLTATNNNARLLGTVGGYALFDSRTKGGERMLRGCDISHHNGDDIITRLITEYGHQLQFVIIKCSEGKTYTDPKWRKNVADAQSHGLLFGLYHYARPENGNTPEEEAENFLEKFNRFKGKCIPCLDWEDKALTYDNNPEVRAEWALRWLNYIYYKTGVKGLLYVQKSEVKKMTKVANGGYGLWVARWAREVGNINPFPFWAMWQYTSSPLDLNYFNGNEDQFMAYCTGDKVITTPKTDIIKEFTIEMEGKKWLGKITLKCLQDSEEV